MGWLVVFVLAFGLQSATFGQIFFTEDFSYADGDLAAVSGGLWVLHSGNPPDIQVVGGSAVVTSPGSQDDNRQIGATMDNDDVWYYALRFSVELGKGPTINNDYFIHLKDNTTTNFNARLALNDPVAGGDFSLSVWSSSEGDGQADWASDFSYGEEIVAVVGYNNGTGDATLWVNPTNIGSLNIVDTELPDAMRPLNAVALRQDAGGGGAGDSSVVTIEVLSIGTDFDEVLDEVTETGGGGTVTADSFSTFRGFLLEGTLEDSFASDDQYLKFNPGITLFPTEPPVWLIFNGTLPSDSPATLSAKLEARANTVGLNQTIQAFNWNSGQYELVDSRNASVNNDSVATVDLTNGIGSYVEQGTGAVRLRIGWRATGPVFLFPWTICIDQVVWEVT
jgi:hypothetical protein